MLINANPYKKLDWKKDGFKKPWVSRKFRREGSDEIVHDLRCDICGRWYNYTTKDIEKIKIEGRWNPHKDRPHHCGNQHCWDYYHLYIESLWKKAEDIARRCYPQLFIK